VYVCKGTISQYPPHGVFLIQTTSLKKTTTPDWCYDMWTFGALMNYPWLFCLSDNLEHRLALPTSSRASVRALIYLSWLCDPRRCEINRKVRAPRRVSASGAPHIVTWIKQTSMHRKFVADGYCWWIIIFLRVLAAAFQILKRKSHEIFISRFPP